MTTTALPWQQKLLNWLLKTRRGRVIAVTWICLCLVGLFWTLNNIPTQAASYHKFLQTEFEALKGACAGELHQDYSSAKFGSVYIRGKLNQAIPNLTSKQRVEFCVDIAEKRGWKLLTQDNENALLCKEGASLTFGVARPYSEWQTDVFLNLSSGSWQRCGKQYPTMQK